MLDPDLQQRFARRCADAAFGYSAASTAAYAAMAEQVLNFWSGVLQAPAPPKPQPASQLWNWPVPMAPTPADPATPLFNPFAWMLPPPPRARARTGNAADQSVGGHVGVRQRDERAR